MGPADIRDRVENLVYEPVQLGEEGIDLTVSAVYEVEEPGRIDFGGDELAEADLVPVETERRDLDDDYEWWHLEAGQYVLQHNEFLAGEGPLWLQPRNELLARGASHPTVRIREHLPLLPLAVGGAGVDLKENARVSTLLPE